MQPPHGWPEQLDTQQARDLLLARLASDLHSGIPRQTLVTQLVQFYGMPAETAENILNQAELRRAHVHYPTRGRARGKTLGGLALAVFGAILIVLSYIHVISADAIESYFIAAGAVLVGVLWIVSGLHDYMVTPE